MASTTTTSASNADDRPLQSRFIGMFSYGSNNEQQLRARVDSPQLRGRPAFLDGYVRVFGHCSKPWAGGSVASVAPKEGGRVYGRFYVMTPKELEILDMYEGVQVGAYSKQAVMVNVCVGETNGDGGGGGITVNNGSDDSRSSFSVVTCSAIAYVMAQRLARRFVAPSPQYLTAVYRTLTSSFPEFSDRAIEIRDYTGSKRSEWLHPGVRALPLGAFLLEVGLLEEPSWTFPTVLEPLVARLAAAGIASTDALCEAVTSRVLLSNVFSGGCLFFCRLAAARDEKRDATVTTTAAGAAALNEGTGLDGGSGGRGGGSGGIPTAGDEDHQHSDEKREWAEARRKVEARATVPEFTEQTVGIIARMISGQSL
ncbi:unnamed protein product [Pylaiella littoralis]